MKTRFPRLFNYIKRLPAGLDSYPECQSKGSIIRSTLDGHDGEELLKGLPEELAVYVRTPPSVGEWTSNVHNGALFLAVCDLFYPEQSQMEAWTRERTKTMGTGLYRGLMHIGGPRIFFRVSKSMQGLFQRGVDVSPKFEGANRMLNTLTFPPHLRSHYMLLANVPMYEELATLTGVKDAKATLEEWDATSAVYAVHWR